jgi:DHA2 family multidrug resistance protein
MMASYNLNASPYYWVFSGIIQGLGMGLFFIPLATLSLSTIKHQNTAEAAGIFNFSRNLGNSIGISVLSTIISSETQINWNRLGGFVNPFNQNLQLWLNHQGWQLYNPKSLFQLQQTIATQAGMVAFIDCFWLVGIALIALIPFVFMIKRTHSSKPLHEGLH